MGSTVVRAVSVLCLVFAVGGVALAKEIAVENLTLAEGNEEATSKFIPWAGSWWPQQDGNLSVGWNGTTTYRYDATQKKYVEVQGVADNDASPLAKYDRYVARKYGQNPGAALVELHGDEAHDFSHHVYGEEKAKLDREGIGYGWWGHCNGWSAAAIMEKEPVGAITAQNIRFEIPDLKGILTEVYYGVTSDYSGSRYYKPSAATTESNTRAKTLLEKLTANNPAPVADYIAWYEKAWDVKMSDSEKASSTPAKFKTRLETYIKWYKEQYEDSYADIRPDTFHKILVSVIKNQKRAVVFDTSANEQVWNYPAFKYVTTVTAAGAETVNGVSRKKFTVRTVVTYSTDGVDEAFLGVSSFDKTYTYDLYTDDAKKLVGGKWTGASVDEHPDFAWVPTFNPTGKDYEENPNMEFKKVLDLLSSDHSTKSADKLTINVKGADGAEVASSSRVATNNTITWANPVRVTAQAEVRLSGTFTSTARRVVLALQPVRTSGPGLEVLHGEMTVLKTLTSAESWRGTVEFARSGKQLLVAQAFDASDRLVSQDEITVDVSTAPASGDDRLEENDTKAQAKTVAAGNQTGLYCGDEDWYKVDVAAGQALEVKIVFQNSEGDIDMKLLDANGGTVHSSGSTSDEETVRRAAGAAGSFFVQVYGYSGAKAAYTMSVTLTTTGNQAPTDDQFEENDTQAAAKAVSRQAYANLQCKDEDWYSIALTAGQTVTFKVAFNHSAGDLDITAHNGAAQVAKSDGVTGEEKVTITATAAGTYTLKVYGYSGATNSYTLTVE